MQLDGHEGYEGRVSLTFGLTKDTEPSGTSRPEGKELPSLQERLVNGGRTEDGRYNRRNVQNLVSLVPG